MSVSSTTTKVSYAGNDATTVFAYTFKIFAAADLEVIIRSSNGTETTKTLTTHYTVSGAGEDAGGNVTMVTPPATGETLVIRRNLTLTQGTDYVENDPFPANSHENALDRLTFITQGIQEELDRAIKASKTNTISSVEFAISAADRANKIFAFDGSGDLSVTQELGTFQGNWAAATDYNARDIVKDTSNNNIYLCNTSHTSSGSQPLSSNADTAKWDLLVDAASATSSASAAATSATNAASSATAAASSASASASSATSSATAQAASEAAQSAAETAQAAAEAAQSAAETAADNFDDIYLGAKASDPATDNDGDPLTTGDIYFSTTSNTLKVYNGSAWQDAALDASSFLASANNLSDLGSAATARTNLGLAIGSDVQAYDADNAVTDAAQTFTAGQRGEITALSDGANISVDLSASNNFSVTLAGNRTLDNPSNIVAGQSGSFFISQDGTGSRTLSFGSYYDFAGGTAPTLTTTASAVDRIDYVVRTATSIHCVFTAAYS